MQTDLVIDGNSLQIQDVIQVSCLKKQVFLHPNARIKIDRIRLQIDQIAEGTTPHYGINTGFGALAETRIEPNDLEKLQHHLILSHAVGVGEPLTFEEARGLMLLRANTLAKGYSGCRSLLLDYLLTLLNAGCAPYVPARGSVGASGDLAPLAHVALLLLGEGPALLKGQTISAQEALTFAKLKPLKLKAKEGLSLINGTQAMAGLGCFWVHHAKRLCDLADKIGACSLEALLGSDTPFDERIQAVRPHTGQQQSAAHLKSLLVDSALRESHRDCNRVQDAYSLRCMPQVHGATRDTVQFVKSIIEKEINSATDNPLVFEREDQAGIEILSGGNFHGQPLAFALDYLAIAVSELANISERRLEQMLNPALSSGLPPFLAPNAGLNSGLMIFQVTAAALINENKILCHPASTDSIPTSACREDHVSMGMTSANKAKIVIDNVYRVLSLELIAACQGIDLRKPLRPSSHVSNIVAQLREEVPFAPEDRAFGIDIEKAYRLLRAENHAPFG